MWLVTEMVPSKGGPEHGTKWQSAVCSGNVRTIWGLLGPRVQAEVGSGNMDLALVRSFSQSVMELPAGTRAELVAGASRTSQLVLQQLVRRTATRFSSDVAGLRAQRSQVDAILAFQPGSAAQGSRREPVRIPVNAFSRRPNSQA